MEKVIITGGTGLVGTRLAELLLLKGYEVAILCRNPTRTHEFKWDIPNAYIDTNVFKGATAILHLAGAGIADQRWTEHRKKEILDSRIQSTKLLYQYLSKETHTIQSFISASAVGYYGDRNEEWLTETSSAGTGFLANVCQRWEAEVQNISSLPMATSIIRIGIVLSKKGGALPKLDIPIKFGIGAYMGNGKQWMPWIHIDDLCRMFVHQIEYPTFCGIYNGCAPGITTNLDFSKIVAQTLHRPFIPAPAPAFILKTLMGEMAFVVLMSNRCSCKKIMDTGFQFNYPTLSEALQNIYHL